MVYRSKLLLLVAVGLMCPVFFQLGGGIYSEKAVYFNSGGSLWLLPIPFSVIFCFLGILFFGALGRVKISLAFILFLGAGLFISYLSSEEGGVGKLILLAQFMLPVFALILGQQFGLKVDAIDLIGKAAFSVLIVVVPLQLLNTWLAGSSFLAPTVLFFSVYQYMQYVPVMFVCLFLVGIFSCPGRLGSRWLVLAFFMGVYVFVSHAMLAILLIIAGVLGYGVRFFFARRASCIVLIFSVGIGIGCGYLYVAGWVHEVLSVVVEFINDAVFSEMDYLTLGGWQGTSLFDSKFTLEEGAPVNLLERVEYWHYYVDGLLQGGWQLLVGHASPPDRSAYPSAHNYYLDLIYNFGLVGFIPLFLFIGYTMCVVIKEWRSVWRDPSLLGLAAVVLFLVLVDNFLKVGLRQPYPGILTFFLWGVLISRLHSLYVLGEGDAPSQSSGCRANG